MSNIPSSAMPHAGTASTGTTTNSTGSATVETPGSRRSSGFGQERHDTAYAQKESGFMERLGDHKVAIAVAAGAVAAAAIPFMLSNKEIGRAPRPLRPSPRQL